MEALTVMFITVSLKHPESMCYVSVSRQWSSMRICGGSLACLTAREGFPGDSVVKKLPAMQKMQETRVQSVGWKDPLEEGMQPTPVFLPGESNAQYSLSLAGYSPQDLTESATTEAT